MTMPALLWPTFYSKAVKK